MQKILILGISSFSGGEMALFLKKKRVKIFGTYSSYKKQNFSYFEDKVKLFKVNFLRHPKKIISIIENVKPNIIIDHASICMVKESWVYPNIYNKINVLTKKNITKYFKHKKFLKKYIYISTPEIFGSNKKKLNESYNIFNPSTPYAKTKLLAENNFKTALKKDKFPIIICRFSNFYGPRQPVYRLIPKVFMSIKLKKIFPLDGGGKSFRDFIYSSDFCEGIYKVIQKGKIGKTYHFSGNKLTKIAKIVNFICKFNKVDYKKFTKITKDRKGKDMFYNLDCRRTKKELNWRPKVTLVKGLIKTLTFYAKNYKYYKNKNLNYKFHK